MGRRLEMPKAKAMREKGLLAFLKEESGVIAVVAAALFPAFAMIVGLVIDFSNATVTKNRLQVTADASALAGAAYIDEDDDVIRTYANSFAEHNMPAAKNGDVLNDVDIEIGNWNNPARVFTPGGAPQNAVRTTTRREGSNAMLATGFGALAGISSWDLTTRAVAVNGPVDNVFCLLALNEHEPESLLIKGTTNITAEDCDIRVNSCHPTEAMKVGGSSVTIDMQGSAAESGSIGICGDYTLEGSPSVDTSVIYPDAGQQEDPFAAVEQIPDSWFDSAGECSATNYTKSINGGSTFTFDVAPSYSGTEYGDVYVMCGGMTISGNGTFVTKPGTYVIKDGPLLVEGQVNFDGSAGQTFYMTGADAYISFGGNTDMLLKGLTQDGSPFEGFAVYGDPDNPSDEEHVLRGTNASNLDGIIYLPGASARITGTSDMSFAAVSDCALFVADTFTIDGTPNLGLKGTCSSIVDADAFVAGDVFLRLIN